MHILVIGDTHGELPDLAHAIRHATSNNCSTIIQVGDFGYCWEPEFIGQSEDALNQVERMMESTDVNLYFIDGNHESFSMLAKYGCRIHDPGVYNIKPRIHYIARGTALNMHGHNMMFCGGAISVDRPFRIPRQTYFWEEQIDAEDVQNCYESFDQFDSAIDYLITHDSPNTEFVMRAHQEFAKRFRIDTMIELESKFNRMKIESIMDYIKPTNMIHGHQHCHYNELYNGVNVIGLDHCSSRISTYKKYHIIKAK